ncbi:MAG: GHMP kinase [Methylovulum sp.]|nr:GHMP kinase [Methylovulum sp.]
MSIVSRAYPRAALVGNPSDGYFGKTIALVFGNFRAELSLWESPMLEILPCDIDKPVFASMAQLVEHIHNHGYYGGIRLLKAAIKCFFEYCTAAAIPLDHRNFTLRYDTTIPQRLGLAGSSAIITACMRGLMQFYGVAIPKPQLANLILSVEKDELQIGAGLQDRVAQVYQGLVYMDFDRAIMGKQGYGNYVPLDIGLLPKLYIAYRTDLAEGSETTHNDLSERYQCGDVDVHEAMAQCAGLAVQVKALLEAGNGTEIAGLINRNFDLRKTVLRISPGNLHMVEAARSVGASANFTGSGGAIIGTYTDDAMYECLATTLSTIGVNIIKPEIVPMCGDEC